MSTKKKKKKKERKTCINFTKRWSLKNNGHVYKIQQIKQTLIKLSASVRPQVVTCAPTTGTASVPCTGPCTPCADWSAPAARWRPLPCRTSPIGWGTCPERWGVPALIASGLAGAITSRCLRLRHKPACKRRVLFAPGSAARKSVF